MKPGLVVVITGDGKGKTTSALGMALRAMGGGLKVLMVQFLKSSRAYGEIKSSQRLHPDQPNGKAGFEIIQVGKDCVYKPEDKKRYKCTDCEFLCHIDPNNPDPAQRSAAEAGFQLAEKHIKSGRYNMVILDEINYAVDYGLISLDNVLRLVRGKPQELHLILTGRNANPQLCAAADLVSEILNIKHPFQKDIKSIKGIDL